MTLSSYLSLARKLTSWENHLFRNPVSMRLTEHTLPWNPSPRDFHAEDHGIAIILPHADARSLCTGVDAAEKKFGQDPNKMRSTNEKVTDKATGMFENATG